MILVFLVILSTLIPQKWYRLFYDGRGWLHLLQI